MEAFVIESCEALLLAVTGGLFLVQVLYQLLLYLRIPRHNRASASQPLPTDNDCLPLSVIIYAHEACEDLKRNLPHILMQDYPEFEVIVITDGADDGTLDYLTLLRKQHAHLRHSFVPDSSRYISHKKLGLTLGIRAARHDWLVMTDADCRPQGNQWLRFMARHFNTPGTQIVLGYSSYERKKGWLHKRIAYDNLFAAMRYLGFALSGHPYMGIGRNLAYRKDLYYAHKGFSQHLSLLRGDDDLFVNRVANGENTQVETQAEAVVLRRACTRAKDWREEKIGYTSTARLYCGMQRYGAGLETLTRLLFHAAWLTTAAVCALHGHWLGMGCAMMAFLLRLLLQMWVVNRNAKTLGESRRYYLTLPMFDILQPLQSLRWKLTCLLRKKSEFLRR